MSNSGKGRSGRIRALVVEPDRRAADRAINLLQDLGYAAHVARDGRDALASLTRPPKLVLLDSSTPIDRAVELLRAMERMRDLRDVPVIGTYERPKPPQRELQLLMDCGVKNFVERPFTAEDIEDALDGGDRSVFSSNSLIGFGEDDASLPPFVSQIRPPVTAPDPRPQANWNVRPPGATTDLAVPTLSAAETLPTVAGSIHGVLEWGGAQVPCVVEAATAEKVFVRTPQPPPLGSEVRVFVAFRAVVEDSTRELPIRVLGEVYAVEALNSTNRVTIKVRVARPVESLVRLGRYLIGQK